MPLVDQGLCTISELEFVIAWDLVVWEEGYMAHDFSNFGELEILDADFIVRFDCGKECIESGHILLEFASKE